MHLTYRPARPEDAVECVAVRGKTRQNALSEDQLRSIGITAGSWAENIRSGALPGHVCMSGSSIIGYCFGSRDSGEIEVLVVLPDFEDRGIGRELLQRTSASLAELGHRRLFLGCSPFPTSRSYGFYRRLGWRSTGTFDDHGDEILEIFIEP
jgi:GNAT superfamily N-acetyltransferase